MALTNIVANVILDLYDHNLTPSTIKTIALDNSTRYVAAVVRNRGGMYDIGQNAGVTLTVVRPDKTKVQITGETYANEEATPEGDTVTTYGAYAELSQLALAIKGNIKAQFKITSGEQELRTEIFTINNGEALDTSDGEWAGDLDGHNLDEMAQSIEDLSSDVTEIQGDVSDLKEGLSAIVSFPTLFVNENVAYSCPVADISDRLIPTWELDDIRHGAQLYWNVDTVLASVHSSDFTKLNIRAVQYDSNDSVLSRTDYPSTLTINANAEKVRFGILYSKSATTGESGTTFEETFAVKFQASYDGNFDISIKALDSVLTEQGDTWEV